ncbi:MAG: hypothetical protein WCA35_10820 [Kovacikia sp.]
MLGRATHPCDDIGKEVFRVFDAVRLYEAIAPVSSMKPLVVNPKLSFIQLVEELGTVTDAYNAVILSQSEESQTVVADRDPSLHYHSVQDDSIWTNPKALQETANGIIDQLLSKLQRKRRHLSESSQEQLEQLAGMPLQDIGPHLKQSGVSQVRDWFEQPKAIAQMLDCQDGGTQPLLIS